MAGARRAILAAVLAVLLVGMAAYAYSGWQRGGSGRSVAVRVGSIRQTVAAIGRVEPFTEVTLANKIPGRIREVLHTARLATRIGLLEGLTELHDDERRLRRSGAARELDVGA